MNDEEAEEGVPIVAPIDETEAEKWRAFGVSLRDRTRELVREALNGCFERYGSEVGVELTERDLEKMSINCELGIMNSSVRRCFEKSYGSSWLSPMFRKVYRWKALSVLYNLRNGKRNPGLIRKVLCKEYPTRALAFMEPRALFPELWEPLIKERLKHELLVPEIQEGGGLIICKNCVKSKLGDGKNVTHYSWQLRSSDEPMTVFCQCLTCGKRWKM